MDPEELEDDEGDKMSNSSTFQDKSQRHNEAAGKFTYFMAGITMAIVAFSLQTYKKPPTLWLTWVYVASWVSLLWSFLFWTGRLRSALSLTAGEAMSAQYAPRREAIKLADQTKRLIIDQETGEPLSIDERERLIASTHATEENFQKQFKALARQAARRFHMASWSLVMGLLLQGVAKTCEVVLEWKTTAGK
jgi:hypothetical protein